jgi:hypothetical protein
VREAKAASRNSLLGHWEPEVDVGAPPESEFAFISLIPFGNLFPKERPRRGQAGEFRKGRQGIILLREEWGDPRLTN